MSNDQDNVLAKTVMVTEGVIDEVAKTTDRAIDPVRRDVAKRYPTIFLLAVTFGVSATFFGFERLLDSSQYLHERPWLILLIGVCSLVVTGTLYKKLG